MDNYTEIPYNQAKETDFVKINNQFFPLVNKMGLLCVDSAGAGFINVGILNFLGHRFYRRKPQELRYRGIVRPSLEHGLIINK